MFNSESYPIRLLNTNFTKVKEIRYNYIVTDASIGQNSLFYCRDSFSFIERKITSNPLQFASNFP